MIASSDVVFLSAAVGVGLVISPASRVAGADVKPTLKCPSVVDLGEIPAKPATPFTIVLANTGMARLEILGIGGSCGCIDFDDAPKLVEPSRSVSLKGKLNPRVRRGAGTRIIELHTNDASKEKERVTIRFKVVPSVDWRPDRVFLRSGAQERLRGCVTVLPGPSGEVSIKGAETSESWLHARVVSQGKRGKVEVALAADAPEGRHTATLKVSLDDAKAPLLEVPVHVYVEPAFTVDPPAAFFGFVTAGLKKELRLRVKHRAGHAVSVRRVWVTDERVVARVSGDDEVLATFDAGRRSGKVSGKVHLELSRPVATALSVGFVAFVQAGRSAKALARDSDARPAPAHRENSRSGGRQ